MFHVHTYLVLRFFQNLGLAADPAGPDIAFALNFGARCPAIGISVLLNLSRASNHARGIAPDKQRDNRKDARRHRSCDWPKNDGHADIPLTHRPRHSYLSASVGSTRNARLGRRSNHQLSGAAAEIHFLFDALNWRSRVVPRKAVRSAFFLTRKQFRL